MAEVPRNLPPGPAKGGSENLADSLHVLVRVVSEVLQK
jgi:hypothetical protein